MVIRKTMSNLEIYNTATALISMMNEMTENKTTLPVKVNFYFQKNMTALVDLGKELESSRQDIITKYGVPNPDNEDQVTIPAEKVQEVNKELNDLFSLEQEVAVNVINLDWFDGVNMTPSQFATIAFMMNEED